jgi:hypothetical protein
MYMKAKDAISGKEGTLLATIDGNVYEVAECKNITAKIDKNKSEFKALGYRGTQHKATGWSGTGSMEVYYASSRWTKMMIDYCKTGKDVYFSLLVVNNDPTSDIGEQRVKLLDVNMNSAEIAKLDVDADYLSSSSDFTFSDVELLDQFSELK